jgi:hypothetical protein
MKKALIVCKSSSNVLGLTLEKVISLIGFEAVIVSHDDAFSVFLSEDFSHIIILDYDEKDDKNAGGFASYRDITASATGQKVIRAGYDSYDHPDYWKLPGELTTLYALLSE